MADFSTITIDFTGFWPLAISIVGALVALIPVRKAIKFVNRS